MALTADQLIADIQNESATYAANAAQYANIVAEFMNLLLAVDIADPNFNASALALDAIALESPELTDPEAPELPSSPLAAVNLLTMQDNADTVFGALPEDLQNKVKAGVEAWLSPFLTDAAAAIGNYFSDASIVPTGITLEAPDIEDLVFAKQQQRIKREYDANTRQAVHNAAKRGFVSFQGQAEGMLYAAQSANSDRVAQAATEAALANFEVWKIRHNTAVEFAKLNYDYAKFIVDSKTSLSNATIGLVGNLAGLLAEGYTKLHAAANDRARLGAEGAKTQADVYGTAIRAEVDRYNTTLDTFKANVDKFRADMELALAKQKNQLANAQLQLEADKTEAELDSRVAVARAQVREAALASAGNMASALQESMARIAAAAQSSLNGIASTVTNN